MEIKNLIFTSQKNRPFTLISAISIWLVIFAILAMCEPTAQAEDNDWTRHPPSVVYKEGENTIPGLKREMNAIEKRIAYEKKVIILEQSDIADYTLQGRELTQSEKVIVKETAKDINDRNAFIERLKKLLEERKEKVNQLEKQAAAKKNDKKSKHGNTVVDELAPYDLKVPGENIIDKKRATKRGKGKDETINAGGNGMLIGKHIRLQDLEGCGTMITGFNPDEEFGKVATPCPALTGGLQVTQKDYLTVCKKYEEPRDAGQMKAYPHPTGLLPVCSTDAESIPFRTGAGLRGTPMTVLCNNTHYGLLANRNAEKYNAAVINGKLDVVFKYSKNPQNLECFFLSRKQHDSLLKEFKKSDKTLLPAAR